MSWQPVALTTVHGRHRVQTSCQLLDVAVSRHGRFFASLDVANFHAVTFQLARGDHKRVRDPGVFAFLQLVQHLRVFLVRRLGLEIERLLWRDET